MAVVQSDALAAAKFDSGRYLAVESGVGQCRCEAPKAITMQRKNPLAASSAPPPPPMRYRTSTEKKMDCPCVKIGLVRFDFVLSFIISKVE